MQYVGAVRKREDAEREARKLSQECGCTVVIEKAKCRDYPSPKRYVCYRGWLDRDMKIPQVIDMKEWVELPKNRELGF